MAGLQTFQGDSITEPGFTDNRVLDEWRIPFGDWYDEAVDWIANTFTSELATFKDGFGWLIELVNDRFLLALPWFVVVIGFFFLGWLLQNIKVGVFSAIALTICGLMGTTYWEETVRTIGFISVAVLLCCIIGIPIGIACGRFDSFWRSVRPVLDAMQVVHSFVYMLPFIYFFRIGAVSATIVTMVFAIPPLIRLTNLGIRQVPEDVVEASRAFGQNEIRILRDVQMPLARPAIMTGINQTLLLAISMLGIAAIMGAGGLARFMFQALNNQDPALSGSAGLSFFLVAVVLDRLTQRDGDSTKSLGTRLNRAWANRKTPENLLEDAVVPTAGGIAIEEEPEIVYEPVRGGERTGILVSMVGVAISAFAVFATWNVDGGWFTSYTRRDDELGAGEGGVDLAGASFNGLEASGGSWFGFILVALALFVLLSGIRSLVNVGGSSNRWLHADGALVGSLAALIMMGAYVLSSPSVASVASSSVGPMIALAGAAVMVVGSFIRILGAKHEPLRPLAEGVLWAPVITGVIAVGILFGAGFASWVHDERDDSVINPELEAEIEQLTAEAKDPNTPQKRSLAIINEIAAKRASAVNRNVLTTDGYTDNGPGFGLWSVLASAVGLAGLAVAAGVVGGGFRRRWIAGSIAMGAGAGVLVIALGWVGTLARATDQNVTSGVGILLTLIAAALLANAGRSIINDFRRSRVYGDPLDRSSISDRDSTESAEDAENLEMAASI